MLSEGRVVARPGLAAAGCRRFRAWYLLLYPAFYDKNFSDTHPWCTFQQAMWCVRKYPRCAPLLCKAYFLRMRVAAVGRDGMLLAVADAYGAFLSALARGAEQGELARLLLEAEGMRGTLERRVASGEVFQRSAGAQGADAQRN